MAGRGRGWEVELGSQHLDYLRKGLAWVAATHPRAKPGPRGVIIFEEKGAPDFVGCLQGGRAIVFDAKSSATPTLPYSELRKKRHQIEALRAVHEAGGLAFLACKLGAFRFVVHYPAFGPDVLSGVRGSIDPTVGVLIVGGDWLPHVLREEW